MLTTASGLNWRCGWITLLLLASSTVFVYFPLSRLKEAADTQRSVPTPMLPFPEPPWRTSSTLHARTLASTPFARFELHQVRTESGAVVDDWMWTDERSHVNILVHLKNENKYLLFFQMKYGLEKPAFATLGGLFNEGETPLQCANRELEEETGLVAGEMIPLGKYRVQVNRGGGFLYSYLAKDSTMIKGGSKLFSDDYEKHEKRLLTREELLEVVLGGKIGEAQWVATAALGLLHDMSAA